MKRLPLTAAVLLGATFSASLLSVFLFGCCVLPFHRYVHPIMPLCGGIVRVLGHRPHEAAKAATPPRRAATIGKAVAPRPVHGTVRQRTASLVVNASRA